MSDPTEAVEKGSSPAKASLPDDALPPVTPPTAGFILQLFLIPMIIVGIVVMVWLMFTWLAHMGADPQSLVVGLEKGDDAAWQRASTLAEMLRDPQRKELRYDRKLAGELAAVLNKQLDGAKKNQKEYKTPNAIRLRIFLCRALGEFHIMDGAPALVRAAKEEPFVEEIDVRRTALESIAVLSVHVGPEQLQQNDELMEAVLAAATERNFNSKEEKEQRAKLRERAVFALGVIGGSKAFDRLVLALDDPSEFVRFNAATGLARHGDARATIPLLEMFELAHGDENDKDVKPYDSGIVWERVLIINNTISSSEKLLKQNPRLNRQPIQKALQKIIDEKLDPRLPGKVKGGIRAKAKSTLLAIEALPTEPSN